jgi:hypothetical protein
MMHVLPRDATRSTVLHISVGFQILLSTHGLMYIGKNLRAEGKRATVAREAPIKRTVR